MSPKRDGLGPECFRDGGRVKLSNRNKRTMTRYFPRLVVAITAKLPKRCVIDVQGLNIWDVGNELRCRGLCMLTAQQHQSMLLDPIRQHSVDISGHESHRG